MFTSGAPALTVIPPVSVAVLPPREWLPPLKMMLARDRLAMLLLLANRCADESNTRVSPGWGKTLPLQFVSSTGRGGWPTKTNRDVLQFASMSPTQVSVAGARRSSSASTVGRKGLGRSERAGPLRRDEDQRFSQRWRKEVVMIGPLS